MIAEAEPSKRAPEPLRLVQQFVNSADLQDGDEDLGSPAELGRWLAKRDLLGSASEVDEEDLRRALEVREGLRAMLLANNGHDADPAAIERLEAAAGRSSLRTRFEPGSGPVLEPDCSGVDGALARLLAITATAAADGTWSRLKSCADEGCAWAFYDHSRNHSAKWCSMASCGNRQKARAYRGRLSEEPAEAS